MKRCVAVLMALVCMAMLFSGCTGDDGESATYKQALAAIETGDHDKALELLLTEKGNEKADALRERFVFVLASSEYSDPEQSVDDKAAYDIEISGNEIRQTIHHPNGSKTKEIFTHGENGSTLVSETLRLDGSWSSKENAIYDSNGNQLTREYTYSDGFLKKETATYDENGNLLTWEETNSDGEWNKERYTYDENGNRLTGEFTDSHGYHRVDTYTPERADGAWYKDKAAYNAALNQWTWERTNPNGTSSQITVTEDSKGNQLAWEEVNSDGSWYKSTTTYDENGNRLTWKETYSDGDWQLYTLDYDVYGNQILGEHSGVEGTSAKYACEWKALYVPEGLPTENGLFDSNREWAVKQVFAYRKPSEL